MIKIGVSKQDITCFIPGIGMMGYGQFHNVVKEIATPLWGRALVLEDDQKKFILVHLEQAFVTMAIREEVLKRIQKLYPQWGMTYANLAITAQHTHSAPGGYGHYPFYNLTIPNFQLQVFEKIVSSIVLAIEEASRRMEEVSVSWGSVEIDPSKEVAFNRSMTAHRHNPEAVHFGEENKHLAVDRTMYGMSFKNKEQKLVCFLNWFGVHNTSISSYNTRIHHDNKGIAATLFENNYPGTTAFFLQASAGDVSPNFFWDKKTKLMRGKFEDQYESAAYNGELQFREAQTIQTNEQVSSGLEFHHTFMDMGLEVAPVAHGVSFFTGTLEGPGMPRFLGTVIAPLCKLIKAVRLFKDPEKHRAFYEAHGKKNILLDHRDGSFIGIPVSVWKHLPPIPDPSVEAFRKTVKKNAMDTLPWTPSLLPFQLLKMGNVLMAFVPGEISVIAGRRLKAFLLKELSELGITQVFLTSYANAYMGYIVTPEEYDEQCYEGGHCVYGRETLTGMMKGFSYLCDELKGKKIRTDLPKETFHFPPAELARRSQ